MQSRFRKNTPKPGKPTISEPKKTVEVNWEEYEQFLRNTIIEFRERGILTDELLRRSPRAARVIKRFLEQQK